MGGGLEEDRGWGTPTTSSESTTEYRLPKKTHLIFAQSGSQFLHSFRQRVTAVGKWPIKFRQVKDTD